MSTLLQLRTRLNGEIGVATDAETAPWSVAVRNQAISDGYAELWRVGVWKDAKQDLASVTNQWAYALTSIRRLDRLELLDSSLRLLEEPKGNVELDHAGTNTYRLRLVSPVATGSTISVRGWTAYVSVFASDAAVDDLPTEHVRVPLLKAKAILWRAQLATFARWGEKQSIPPEMNLSIDQFLAMIAAAEREFETEARSLANLRPRTGRVRSV